MSNHINFKQTILEHAILNREAFLDKYNPWQTERGKKVIEDYTNIINGRPTGNDVSEENFSWLAVEEVLEEKFIGDRETKIPANMDFGLPNHVKGDIDSSNLFMCLTNPNIQIEDRYLAKAQHINEDPTDLISTLLEYMAIFDDEADVSSKKENFPNKNEVNKHIINFDENILGTEFGLLMKNVEENGLEYLDAKYKNSTGTKKHVWVRDFYYLGNYFHPIFISNNDSYLNNFKTKLKKKLSQLDTNEKKEQFLKEVKASSICNLESFPFRSTQPGIGKKGFGSVLLRNKTNTILFSARIIFRRIALYLASESGEKPIFIFRRFNDAWKNSLEHVLLEDYKVPSDQLNAYMEWLENKYFFTFSFKATNKPSSALFTKTSVKKYDSDIKDEDLNEIKKASNIPSLD